MPGSVKIRIIAARNLPVMDRSTFLTDAFVEVRIGNEFFKTEVAKRSLNPQWNSDWITFELDDQQLQEEVLQIRVLDHDTYSAHDSIGRVYIDLNALLLKKKKRCFSGWLSIYDTMHGIRGEINVAVKVDLFSDVSKFRQSSVGVKFFYSTCIPVGFNVITLFGFVEELVMMDDPEHQWREKLRTSRASNETRQRLFSKLSGELQRKMGVKVLEMGGNSVIGYQLHFDLEGETGVVIRGIGTVAELMIVKTDSASPPTSPMTAESIGSDVNMFEANKSHNTNKEIEESMTTKQMTPSIPPIIRKKLFDFGVFPFLTIASAPSNFIKHFGSVVSVKSVKLIEKSQSGDERECRDSWWLELRNEIASHMRVMNCNAVMGYSENCIIDGDVCVLTGYGTAVFIDIKVESYSSMNLSDTLNDGDDFQCPEKTSSIIAQISIKRDSKSTSHHPPFLNIDLANKFSVKVKKSVKDELRCHLCHLPGGIEGNTFSNVTAMCRICNQACVPEVIFSTTEIPEKLRYRGKPALIQTRVCRYKKESKGELCAKEINDILPFLEYEMHYKLVQNLSMKGMNAIFGLKVRLCLGENLVVAIGTGTGIFLTPLPAPATPKSNQYGFEEDNIVLKLNEFRALSKEFFDIESKLTTVEISSNSPENTLCKPSPDELTISQCRISNRIFNRSLNESSKRTSLTDNIFIDTSELNNDYVYSIIREGFPPPNVTMETTNSVKCKYSSKYSQMIFRFVRSIPLVSIEGSGSLGSFSSEKLDTFMQEFNSTLWLKLRRLMPCVVSGIDYTFNLTEDDGFEAMVTGFVSSSEIPLNESNDNEQCIIIGSESVMYSNRGDRCRKETSTSNDSILQSDGNESQPPRFLISPLSSISGYYIDAYLGNLNFFFVRETTSLREFGGVSGFIQALIGEVQSVVASQTIAIGGSGLLSCHITEMILNYPTNGRQMNSAQCLINICGDMVLGHF